MALELLPATAAAIPRLSVICHEAFSALHDRCGVERDIPAPEVGEMIIGQVAQRPDYTGVMAVLDGEIVGSNFLFFGDEVGGVGPITVDPKVQSKGIGRALMQWAIDEARRREIRQVRLFQEAINITSFSLYTALGFDWRDTGVLMQATPAGEEDPDVRAITADDLPAIADLSRRSFGFSREVDAGQLIAWQVPGFVKLRGGKPVAYLFGTLFGHAGAETEEDLLALAAQAARHLPPPVAKFICPMSRPGLYRKALATGHRTGKLLSYMSLGGYTPPPGAHFPSIQC
ncbi:GNAT family N-acetyltransferase [Luteolibacter flavescens]|uniref:GNAT family N-acetyltransferase n=1 Tax=Luteolibacter flavescens TaxID=1859460 RepID=A0ABT3FPB5_9BACT|nr:GNAT family N-acetyltransferase [Luteolibacter flavescens]MCW1885393.1 GNAT family N-acetyltransferase [Luteolibacter flavescens]